MHEPTKGWRGAVPELQATIERLEGELAEVREHAARSDGTMVITWAQDLDRLERYREALETLADGSIPGHTSVGIPAHVRDFAREALAPDASKEKTDGN